MEVEGGMEVEGEWTIEKRTFHSGESRNLILATARIFREAEHCNGRLSANAAVAAEIPAFAGMEMFFYFGAHSFFRNWPMRQRWGNKFPRKFHTTINCGARYIFFKEKNISHSRESGNLPVILTVLERDAGRQLEVGEIPAFAGMGVRGEGMGGGRIYKSPSIHAFKSSISS